MRRAVVLSLTMICLAGAPAWARPQDAPGGPEGKGPCVRACSNSNRGCARQAQLAKLTCRYGCADLQEIYLVSCGIKDFDPEHPGSALAGIDLDNLEAGCEEAKSNFEQCWNPCRVAFSRAARSCVGKLRACFFRQCGILPPPTTTP